MTKRRAIIDRCRITHIRGPSSIHVWGNHGRGLDLKALVVAAKRLSGMRRKLREKANGEKAIRATNPAANETDRLWGRVSSPQLRLTISPPRLTPISFLLIVGANDVLYFFRYPAPDGVVSFPDDSRTCAGPAGPCHRLVHESLRVATPVDGGVRENTVDPLPFTRNRLRQRSRGVTFWPRSRRHAESQKNITRIYIKCVRIRVHAFRPVTVRSKPFVRFVFLSEYTHVRVLDADGVRVPANSRNERPRGYHGHVRTVVGRIVRILRGGGTRTETAGGTDENNSSYRDNVGRNVGRGSGVDQKNNRIQMRIVCSVDSAHEHVNDYGR